MADDNVVQRRGDDDESKKYRIPATLSEGDYAEQMTLAIRLALEAGGNMIEHLERKGTISGAAAQLSLGIAVTKTNDTDFATNIDLTNEAMIMSAIEDRYPSHVIIGEESTGTGKTMDLTDAPTWIIDPIDGTTNFAAGSPLTCVSIGFCNGGEPVMGVIFAPATRELYLAMKGRGSYRNGERIFSTTTAATTTPNDDSSGNQPTPTPSPLTPKITLSNAVVCFEFGYARSEEGVDKMVNAVKRILLHGCRTTRSYGSGVLDLCYVASGRIDVVYTGLDVEGWKPWDYCAAMVVVEEAGGVIRSLRDEGGTFEEFDEGGRLVVGSKFDIYSSSMICGVNSTVVEECRNVVLGV